MSSLDDFPARPGVDRPWTREDAVYPRGICPDCGAERRIRNVGTMGAHRRIINKYHRGPYCSGVDKEPTSITWAGREDESEGRGDAQRPDSGAAGEVRDP